MDLGDGGEEAMEIDAGNKDSVILGEHPGRINSEREVRELAKETERKVLTSNQDIYGMFYLKDGKKED